METWDYKKFEKILDDFSIKSESDDPKERMRIRIVNAATELFIKQGYRKTSVDEIAKRASVAKGTIYLYFKTKSEIMLQAIIEEKNY